MCLCFLCTGFRRFQWFGDFRFSLSNIDPSIGEQLQQSHDYVHSIYEMTLKAFNEFNKPVPEYNFAPILAKTRLLNETVSIFYIFWLKTDWKEECVLETGLCIVFYPALNFLFCDVIRESSHLV